MTVPLAPEIDLLWEVSTREIPPDPPVARM
jgi:hypothetical protein